MAKKRLNKKVALVGFIIFIVFALGGIAAILYFSRDPEKYVKDGDAAFAAKDYETATYCYLKARALSKSDEFRVQMLFKLADLYIETDKWRNVIGCWNEIIRLDTKNIKAYYGRLKYFYTMADSGAANFWQDVDEQASQFIELVEDQDLLNEQTSKWETFGLSASTIDTDRLGPYLYIVRGRALLERAKRGAVTDPEELISRSVGDLEKVLELDANSVDAYWYLAQAYVARGNIYASRGDIEGKNKDLEQAKELLERSVNTIGTLQSRINLLAMTPHIAQINDREQLKTLEPQYLALVEKFSSDAKAYSALAGFYASLGYRGLDKAIAQITKAIDLDKENVGYAITAAGLYYQKFSMYGEKESLHNALEIAKQALQLPGAQETKGPQQRTNKINRIVLNSFLASSYIEQILNPSEDRTDAQKQELMANAEQAVHEIEQLYGSGEEPVVIKWRGMLELAKGNRDDAIRQLVATYEQFKAAGQRDTQLAYMLGKLFENSDELGAVADFWGNALSITDRSVPDKIDEHRPEVLLDYTALLIKLRAYDSALSIIDYFEKEYWENSRSRILRIEAYIGAKQFDEAAKELAKRNAEDPNTIRLNLALTAAKTGQIRAAIMRRQMEESSNIWQEAMKKETDEATAQQVQSQADANNTASLKTMSEEFNSYTDSLAELVGRLLPMEPNLVESSLVISICESYLGQGKTDKARAVADKYLEKFPKNTNLLVYRKICSEPEPDNISPQRRKQIEREVLSSTPDPVSKAMYLAAFFQRNNEPNNAIEEYKKVLGIIPLGADTTAKTTPEEAEKTMELRRSAAPSLMDMAVQKKDVKLAEQIADIGKQDNLDRCNGKFFAAVVAMVKQDYKGALNAVDDCLKQRPIFSYGYMLRSNIDSLLGDEHASLADIQKAASMNLLDGNIAKVLARELYVRNQKLGLQATDEQMTEAKTALDRAMALNPNDTQLLGFYAEYISDVEPLRALAIRQALQKMAPSLENALFLGKMALKVADRETDQARKDTLYAVAVSSLQQALAYEPRNQAVLESLGEYYRITGQTKKAEDLLAQSQEPKLLWRHFLMAGQPDKAKELLLQMQTKDQKDSDILRGLVFVSQYLNDVNAVKKYSKMLVDTDDTSENRLLQIQTFLQIGLLREAEDKLSSFAEKYPADTRGLQVEGWLAMRQGKLAKAMELANKSLELNQDDATAWRLRGEINYLMSNNDQAVADLKKSKALSDKPVIRISLARALLRTGRGQDAVTELESLLDDPKAPVEGALLLEELYRKYNMGRSLVNLYRQVLKNFPDNLLWYDRAGRFALDTNDFSSAITIYETGWNKSGQSDRFMLDGYLQSLLAAGEVDKFMEETGKYVDGALAPVALYRIGEAKLKQGSKEEAIQYCRKAVEKTSDNENAATWVLEKMYLLLGHEEVLKICTEKLQVNPNSPSANLAMFEIMKLNGQYNKALEYIDKCSGFVQAGSDSEVELKMKKVEVLQMAYLKTSDNNYFRDAVAEYESLLAKMPNNTNILNNLAYLLADADEQLDKAVGYAKRAREIAPNDAAFMDTYAYTLYKNGLELRTAGKEGEAKDKFTEAAELSLAALQQYEQRKISVPAEVYEHLGMAKEALGEKTEAIKAYEQTLETGTGTLPKSAQDRVKMSIDRLSQ